MKTYTFTLSGKIKQTFDSIIVFGTAIVFLVFISKFNKLYYFTWIPILWCGYQFLLMLLEFIVSYSVNEEGLIMHLHSFHIRDIEIMWKDIKKVKIIKPGSRIASMWIYTRDGKRNLVLREGLEDFQELVSYILTHLNKEESAVQYKGFSHLTITAIIIFLLLIILLAMLSGC